MVDRITLLLKTRNISASQFADEIGVQRSSISHVLSGRNKPSLDFIQKILVRYPEINPDWLLFGKGSMNLEYNLFSELTDPVPVKPEALSKAIQRQERPVRLVSDPAPVRQPEFDTKPKFEESVHPETVSTPVQNENPEILVPPTRDEPIVTQPVQQVVQEPVPEIKVPAIPEPQIPVQQAKEEVVKTVQPPVSEAAYTGAATMAALAPLVEKEVEQITIFYKDRTFVLYKPG